MKEQRLKVEMKMWLNLAHDDDVSFNELNIIASTRGDRFYLRFCLMFSSYMAKILDGGKHETKN